MKQIPKNDRMRRCRQTEAYRRRPGEDRDMKKRFSRTAGLILTILLMCAWLGGCSAGSGQLNRYQLSSTDLFDTVTVITGFAEDEQQFRSKADQLLKELLEWHQLCDIYHAYDGINNARTVNLNAGGEPVQVDSRLTELLLFARELSEATGGKVDVTLGAMLREWHEARETGIQRPEEAALPDAEALEQAMAHTGFDLLEIDPEAGTVRLTDPEASLDLGALAKGYAAQQVCGHFEAGWLVNLGGNVCATGPKPTDGSPWIVGIQNPDGNGSDYVHAVRLEQGAVVTSGDYQRWYEVDGVRYHHLIDPETRMPGRKWRSVTILHEDSGLADGLSTALFLMNREEGEALLQKLGGEACWIAEDGGQYTSAGYGVRIRR